MAFLILTVGTRLGSDQPIPLNYRDIHSNTYYYSRLNPLFCTQNWGCKSVVLPLYNNRCFPQEFRGHI